MTPYRDVTSDLRKIFKQATPRKPEQVPDPPGPSAREIKIRVQIALYAVIAAFGMAAFLYGDSRLAAQGPKPTIRVAALTDELAQPLGKIISPIAHAVTDRTVTLTGYTENIPVDTPFVWLMVDVPSIGRTWPKKPVIRPNGSFQVTIFEGGPNLVYNVSLYAVGYGLNRAIEQWVEESTFGGLPMIPAQYRLDSVRLVLGGV